MKRVLRHILLILPVFLFLLGHGAKFGFCPCEDSFFVSSCDCSLHKQEPVTDQGVISPCCSDLAAHKPNILQSYDSDCDDIMAEVPDLPYQSSSTSLSVPPFSAVPLRIEELLSFQDSPCFFLEAIHSGRDFPFDPPLDKRLYTGVLSPLRA